MMKLPNTGGGWKMPDLPVAGGGVRPPSVGPSDFATAFQQQFNLTHGPAPTKLEPRPVAALPMPFGTPPPAGNRPPGRDPLSVIAPGQGAAGWGGYSPATGQGASGGSMLADFLGGKPPGAAQAFPWLGW